jgi:acyl carrier protein
VDVQALVHGEIILILRERGHARPAIANDDALTAELGLSSSDVARLITRLTAALGVDPFARGFTASQLQTVGDLCRSYRAREPAAAGERAGTDALRASRDRARARRGPWAR